MPLHCLSVPDQARLFEVPGHRLFGDRSMVGPRLHPCFHAELPTVPACSAPHCTVLRYCPAPPFGFVMLDFLLPPAKPPLDEQGWHGGARRHLFPVFDGTRQVASEWGGLHYLDLLLQGAKVEFVLYSPKAAKCREVHHRGHLWRRHQLGSAPACLPAACRWGLA